MKHIASYNLTWFIAGVVVLTSWLAGVVLAQGWLKAVAAVIPPYAWYLTVERLMQLAGVI